MGNITVLGIDISKNIFELCGLDSDAHVCYRKRVTRSKFVQTVIQLGAELVVMEACGGANHWARVFTKNNVNVKLISPQFVKPFVKTNKNDYNDAEGTAIAGNQGHMRFVSHKSLDQQDIQCLLRARDRVNCARTKIINEVRGFGLEYGVTIPKGANQFYKKIVVLIEDEKEQLTPIFKRLINRMYTELLNLDEEKAYYDQELKAIFDQSEQAQLIEQIPGVGELTALSIIALVGDINTFSNGRHFAAYLGLVPRQYSSGGKDKLLGISKRGNVYVRSLLVHGARSVLAHVKKKEDKKSVRLQQLIERRGFNRACIALANKHARIIWSMLQKHSDFKPSLAWS